MKSSLERAVRRATRRPDAFVWLVCGVSLIVRTSLVFLRGTWELDHSGYDTGRLVHRMVEDVGVQSSYSGPVYVYAWAWALSAWGTSGQLVIQIGQALLLSFAPWCLYRFARLYFAVLPAVIAACLFALYPELLVLATTMYADTVALSLWCVILALYAAVLDGSRKVVAAILFGLCVGLLVLTKGRFLAFSAILIFFLLANDPNRFSSLVQWSRRHLQAVLLILAVASAVVAPWAVRNYRVHGELLLLESTTGLNLWIGHNPKANGTARLRPSMGGAAIPSVEMPRSDFPQSPELVSAIQAARSELERDRAYRDEAFRSIRTNPIREIPLSIRKAVYFWTIDPTSLLSRHPLYWIPWAGILVLFGIGVAHRARQGLADPLLWSFLLAGTALAVVFFVIARLRYPVYPAVFLFAGQGAAVFLARLGVTRGAAR